ncbi:hypothetical protein P280DRAFT_542083 [Massarina eburnea CBS 473.64]|uniref:Enterotoxin n=1 Tax=Massarina eburnea CBS 473.64 TaxID=1395130 RepID=A0A6A6S113_9PLEO|nr:hypothetical protein P280DRAFT_542083 [Massarina eburnea CBS 473.64]
MRTLGFYKLAALISFFTITVNGLECHIDITRNENDPNETASKLLEPLNGSIRNLCNRSQDIDIEDAGNQISYSTTTGWSFYIHRETHGQSVKDCLDAFKEIINQCVATKNVEGGQIDTSEVAYLLTYDGIELEEEIRGRDEDEDEASMVTLEVRDYSWPQLEPRRLRNSKYKPRTTTKSKITSKPKPTTSSKSTVKGISTAVQSNNASQTGIWKPIKTKTCKELAIMDNKALLESRDIDAGYGQMHPHAPREILEKRSHKTGKVCGESQHFNAKDYPARGVLRASNPNTKYYGFADPYNCKSYEWRADSPTEPAGLHGAGAGQSEHVLEWQSVTGFIDWLDRRYTSFQDPELKSNGQVSFCEYITKYWDLPNSRFRFALAGGNEMTPVEHIASVYPSNDQAYRHEFVLLQDTINMHAKARMWTDGTQIYKATGSASEKTMAALLRDEPWTVILRLRNVVGARKYQSDAHIRSLFVAQKTRIHDMLAKLDTALPLQHKQGFRPWDPTITDLAEQWDTYMNEAFANANSKQEKFMNRQMVQFKTTYCTAMLQNQWKQVNPNDSPQDKQHKTEMMDLCDSYNTLVRAWKELKTWTRPW